jgi:hypothetical protein
MNDTHGPGGDMEQDDLDLYVDGLLDDERRAAFERKLFADPELAAALERQRSLKARLTAAFPVPEDPVAIAQRALAAGRALPGGRPRRVGGRRLALLRVAVAASLLAALGLWAAGVFHVVDEAPAVVVDTGGPGHGIDGPGELVGRVDRPGPDVREGEMSCVAFGGLYAELADDWRQAAAACRLPHDLARHFQESLGQELLVDREDELPIEGPCTIRRWPTTTLLVSPQQPEPILILVDQLARDPRPVLEPGSPAHLFRRELGGLVLYELTPWDTSRALGLFHLR